LTTHFDILKRDGHENREENGKKREEKKEKKNDLPKPNRSSSTDTYVIEQNGTS